MTRRGSRSERGAAMVEFVLIAPFLFGMLFLIISYGVMLNFRSTMSQAATEGARAAAVSPVRDATGNVIDRNAIAASTVSDSFTGQVGGNLTCTGGSSGTLSPILGSVCTTSIQNCPNDASVKCMTVVLSYPYRANPRVSGSSFFGASIMPATLTYTARARVN